ncbi:hypothetical protein FRC05_003100 [Tulasnella sp. 425]|nr:hypothetical protein FRC05_003100 [Tulasnella sp. 425]
MDDMQTGRTDIPLTEHGMDAIKKLAPEIVGPGKLLDPENICHAWVSPRQRAHKTFELLFESLDELPPHKLCEDVREWDYGNYEGLTPAQIKEKDKYWSIWKDGCPGGESVEEMTKRVDGVISEVHEIHRKYFEDGEGRRDALIVAHGHFSRVLISRWVEFPLCLGTHFNVEPAGTGRTDIPSTERGVDLIKQLAPKVVGPGKLLDPENLGHVWVSPRQRARRTFELLFESLGELPQHVVSEDVGEWDHGNYEGLTLEEIQENDKYWSIWKDGCPGGESVEEMTQRVDGVIAEVHEVHRKYFEDGEGRRDALIVAHGTFSRALIARWMRFPLCLGTHFNIEPAGIVLLTYNHRNLEEPVLTGLNLHAF